VTHVGLVDRKATAREVLNRSADVRRLADAVGLTSPRLRDDGTIVVHSDEPGYRAVTRLSSALSELVGAYVHVITDDVPGAGSTREL
jgi:hypothetical protein